MSLLLSLIVDVVVNVFVDVGVDVVVDERFTNRACRETIILHSRYKRIQYEGPPIVMQPVEQSVNHKGKE